MATRYYPSKKATNVIIHGPLSGDWNDGVFSPANADYWAWRLQTTKTSEGGSAQTQYFATNQQGNHDFPFHWRWMTHPLQAQTISGTFDLCFGLRCYWDGTTPGSSIARYKVHIYIAQGQSVIPRAVILDNYIDSVNFPTSASFKSLVTPQTLTTATVEAGDIIVVEIGMRVVSSPTPVPTYPPSENTIVIFQSAGVNPSYPDATAGVSGNYTSWLEFSDDILEQALPAAPANDACSDAIAISSIPHVTDFIDSSQSADTQRGIWWTFTPTTSGILHVTAHGSNYEGSVEVYTGTCGALSLVSRITEDDNMSAHRSQAFRVQNITSGVQYWVKFADYTNGGGLGRLNLFYQPTAYQDDDIFLANGGIFAFRNGQLINYGGDWADYNPTGIAIDYTKRPLVDFHGVSNVNERILIGLHAYELVEIADIYNLNSELDYIGDPWRVSLVGIHPAQSYITRAGMLHQGWFGDGYLYVAGSGSLPAQLNTVSSIPSYSSLKSIDSISSDGQDGEPFTDVERILDIEVTAPWAIVLDEATNILYYTSGGLYVPVGGQIIKRYNISTNAQLPDFATVTLQGTKNPGLKGLCLLPDGGLLVCNGIVVNRLNSSGTVTQTYTPSISMDSQTLIDVKLTKDGTKFWVVDLWTTRLFQFNLATGAELLTFQPYGTPGSLVQMALYNPNPGDIVPPTSTPGLFKIVTDKRTDHNGVSNTKIPDPTFKTGLIP